MAITITQKAPRDKDGRVKGVFPSQLTPKVVRQLSTMEQVRAYDLTRRSMELTRNQHQPDAREKAINLQTERRAFYTSLGLDLKESYKFWPSGDVTIIGKHMPTYR